jgi:hypothetical protein
MESVVTQKLLWLGGVLALGAIVLGLGLLADRLRGAAAQARARAGTTMTAGPVSASVMPARRTGPNCSPKTSAAAAAPAKGTSRANGVTVAAG